MNTFKHISYCCFVIFCIVSYSGGTSDKPCAKKFVGKSNKNLVCVCNSTYCDEISVPKKLNSTNAAVYKSSKNMKRFYLEYISFCNSQECYKEDERTKLLVKVNANKRYQTVLGFGGAFTDSVGINLNSLSKDTREKLLNSYFGPEGIQYSLGRIPMASCDFSTHEYSYGDENGDFNWKKFNLTEEDYQLKIPHLLKALKLTMGNLKLLATPWSAPAWMKTNNRMKGGGLMKGSMDGPYYTAWAQYFIRFLEEYSKNGINMWGLTVQNEPSSGADANFPFQTMYFNASLERDFIKKHLGPALRNSDIGKAIALIVMDDQRIQLPYWADKILRDEEAAKYIAGIGLHWYENWYTSPQRLTETHNHFPNKFILATEACNGYIPLDRGPRIGDWGRGEAYAFDIIQDMTNWVCGWLDWNLCLDLQGGPNWVKNFVDSAILVNSTADEFYKQPMFYAMGHFSKFVRPNSTRIGVSIRDSPKCCLDMIAFDTPLYQRVLIVSNRHDEASYILVIEDSSKNGKILKVPLEPRTIATILWNIE